VGLSGFGKKRDSTSPANPAKGYEGGTTLATIAKQRLEIKTPEKGYFGLYTETASVDFKIGEFVTLAAAGTISNLSGTDPAAATIAGIALEDSENLATPLRKKVVFVPDRDCLFVLNAGVAQVTALADIGDAFESVEAANLVHVDNSATTVDVWKIINLDTRDAVGDTNGRYIAKLVADRLQLSPDVSA